MLKSALNVAIVLFDIEMHPTFGRGMGGGGGGGLRLCVCVGGGVLFVPDSEKATLSTVRNH